MSSVIIFEKDLEKLGRKVMKEFYYQIHNDYMLTFDEIKLKRKYYDENIAKEFLFFENKRSIIRADLNEMKTEDLLKEIKTQIKEETLDYKIIFSFLDFMNLRLKIDKDIDFELNEDLFCLKKAFINIYNVYHNDIRELKD